MSVPHAFFVTGTDTGVGKTRACTGFLARGRQEGRSCAGLKPVASGCASGPEGLRSADALALMAAATASLPYAVVNPWAFEPAIAPHVAADRAGTPMDFSVVRQSLDRARGLADLVVVEGVGGWLVPLSGELTAADLAVDLGLPVVLVVGLRLGCLSHALLTVESIAAHGSRLVGWVASVLDPAMPALEANLRTLELRIPAPLLGCLPFAPSAGPAEVALGLRLPDAG
jgi:dethiobiotin synthetase